jgi:hypothetical protein
MAGEQERRTPYLDWKRVERIGKQIALQIRFGLGLRITPNKSYTNSYEHELLYI